MSDLDVFREEFVPNIESHARLSFDSWKKTAPADYGRWVAYRDALLAGGTPAPPAMSTKYGKALVATGKMVTPEQAPTLKGISFMRWGNGESPPTHQEGYDAIYTSWGGASRNAALGTRSVVYMSAVSCLEARSWHYGVTGEDAVANGWVLKQGTRLLRNAGYTQSYIADPAASGYQARWCDNVIALCQGWGVDGVFVDDFYGSLSLADGTPDRYPTLASQRAALVAFAAAVYPRLQAAGLYVCSNSAVYEGQAGDDEGTTTLPWWELIAPYVDGLAAEYWQWRDNNPTAVKIRKLGPEWYNHWDTWQALPAWTEAHGKEFLGIAYSHSETEKTYILCSMLLETTRGSSACMGTNDATLADPWIPIYGRLPLGAALGPKVKNGNRWQRQYAEGLVWVDPVAGTAGIV